MNGEYRPAVVNIGEGGYQKNIPLSFSYAAGWGSFAIVGVQFASFNLS
jgi:hypothetical protein